MQITKTLKPPDIIVEPASLYIELATLVKGFDVDGLDDYYEENDVTEAFKSRGVIFINDHFLEVMKVKSGVLFLAGGYGSSKTTLMIVVQLIKSMTQDFHRCYYGRAKKVDGRKFHQDIVDIIEDFGWQDYFHYSDSPTGHTTITCKINNNKFIMFGCDNKNSLKGMGKATDIMVDEINQLMFESVGMLLTRLRMAAPNLLFAAAFNNCDVKPGHWLRKLIYSDEVPEQTEITDAERRVLEALKKRKIVRHHSKYTHNLFLNHDRYRLDQIAQSEGSESRALAILEGDWAEGDIDMPYYNGFNEKVHVVPCAYNPDFPLWLSLDENYNPYLPAVFFQVDGRRLMVLKEFIMKTPRNDVQSLCRDIVEYWGPQGKNHTAGMFITGDRTAKKIDGKLEQGADFFVLFERYLEWFNPRVVLDSLNPSVSMRASFVNAILRSNYSGISVNFDPSCSVTITDFLNVEIDSKGQGKDKRLRTVDGKRVQKYGHTSDIFDYASVQIFKREYMQFQMTGSIGESKNIGNGSRNRIGGNSGNRLSKGWVQNKL
jgi:hypothetical protein